MRYLLILAIVLVSMCTSLPDLSFLSSNSNIQQAENLLISEGPDLYITADTIPTEVKAGRNVNVYFELRNKNNFNLNNVKLTVYDPCVFTGDVEKLITQIKANSTYKFSVKWTAGSVEFDTNCKVKFRVTYDAQYSLYQDIAVLTQEEYSIRESKGTLSSVPISSSYPASPLKISLSFSDSQPFVSDENYNLLIGYTNTGDGIIEIGKGDITIKAPSNVKDFSCRGYDSSLALNTSLNFIRGSAPTSSCSFTATTTQALNTKPLSITAKYKYNIDSSISIKVLTS